MQTDGNASKDRGQQNRKLFLEALKEHGTIERSCLTVGVGRSAYEKWRQRYPDFAAKADAVRIQALEDGPPQDWDGSFQTFRGQYFGHSSPWFHLRAIEAYENTQAGNITMILWPPEHGKTTLAEDYFCYKLATNPEFRITVGSEGQDMSRKILGRVRSRMEPHGPFPAFVGKFGPFVPQSSAKRSADRRIRPVTIETITPAATASLIAASMASGTVWSFVAMVPSTSSASIRYLCVLAIVWNHRSIPGPSGADSLSARSGGVLVTLTCSFSSLLLRWLIAIPDGETEWTAFAG